MHKATCRSLLAVLVSAALVQTTIAQDAFGTAAIGTAIATGTFRTDNAEAWGNAAVFPSSVIEAGDIAVAVRLSHGTITLAPSARAKMGPDTVTLESGLCEVHGALTAHAGNFLIALSGPDARTVLVRQTPENVGIIVQSGSARVSGPQGPIAALHKDQFLTFEAGGTSPKNPLTRARVLWLEKRENGNYVVDSASGQAALIPGNVPAREVGTGFLIDETIMPSQPGLSGTIQVNTIKRIDARDGPIRRAAMLLSRAGPAPTAIGQQSFAGAIAVGIILGIAIGGGYIIWRLSNLSPRQLPPE